MARRHARCIISTAALAALAATSVACTVSYDTRLAGREGRTQDPGFTPPGLSEGGFPPPVTATTRPSAPAHEKAKISGPQPPVSGPPGRCDRLFQYQLSAGQPAGVAVDGDGSVWFTDPATGTIGHMTVAGDVTRYELEYGATPRAIVRGPDGNFWFTDGGSNTIGRIRPDGDVRQTPIPTEEGNPMGYGGQSSGPFDITAGPDGALWFTEAAADKIGRISVDFHITEYPLPRRERMHANPEGITAGPGNAVWASEPLTMRLARVDVATGEMTEIVIPGDGPGGPVGADSLATAGDGAIWFDDPAARALGRMTPDGDVVRLPLPASGQYRPSALTVGPDRAIWFLDVLDGRVMRMAADGAVTEFPMVTEDGRMGSAGARQLAAGAHSLWFAQPDNSRLGRVVCRP